MQSKLHMYHQLSYQSKQYVVLALTQIATVTNSAITEEYRIITDGFVDCSINDAFSSILARIGFANCVVNWHEKNG